MGTFSTECNHWLTFEVIKFDNDRKHRPISFEDILTILVSIFHLLRDERKRRESFIFVMVEF